MATYKTVIIIVSGGNSVYDRLEETQKVVFARSVVAQPDVKVIWARGCAQETHWNDNENTLYLAVADGMETLLEKTCQAVEWVLEMWNPAFIIRSNNSSFWDLRRVHALTDELPSAGLYGGIVVKEPSLDPSTALARKYGFISGSALWMSQDTARMLVTLRPDAAIHQYDDVAIGMLLGQKGLKMTKIPSSDLTDYRFTPKVAHHRVKHWSKPSVTARRLKILSKLDTLESTRGRALRVAWFVALETWTMQFETWIPMSQKVRRIASSFSIYRDMKAHYLEPGSP